MKAKGSGWFGPGLIMAASGIGASDIVSATVGGGTHGHGLLWALVLGAFFKFVLSEGLARWQLGTGATVLEGAAQHVPRGLLAVFGVYLVAWSVAVSGALIGGCGLAVETLSRGAVPRSWGALAHAAVAALVLGSAGGAAFTRVMKPLIALMFFAIVSCAALTFSQPGDVLRGLVVPTIPERAGAYVLSLIGGIGGSLTLLAYSYLLREEGGNAPRDLPGVRRDLGVAYAFTAIFGVSVMLIAQRAFHSPGLPVSDRDAVSRMAGELAQLLGPAGYYIYAVGFWAAVAASLFGVWQSVPYIFADTWRLWRREPQPPQPRAPAYRCALAGMALAAVPFAFVARPVLVIVAFTVVGSIFIPLLAATLLYLNNRHLRPANHPTTNAVLLLIFVLFLAVGGWEIAALLPGR